MYKHFSEKYHEKANTKVPRVQDPIIFYSICPKGCLILVTTKGRKEGRTEGRKEGRKEGKKEGKKEGRKEGRMEGRRTSFTCQCHLAWENPKLI